MDEDVVTVLCPACAARVAQQTPRKPAHCPRCGHLLPDGDERAMNEPADKAVEPNRADAATVQDDDALIANLREAFGFSGDGANEQGGDRPGPGADSTGFRRILDVAALPPNSRIGDFEILDELGRGGMGVVYRARQISLGREVALKVLPGCARRGRAAVQRFRAEARAAARVHHTNVVPIYAQGEDGGQFYYAMELVNGVGLDTVIRSRPDLLSSTRARSALTDRSDGHGLPTPAPLPPMPEPAAVALAPHWTRDDYRHIAALLADVADGLECAHRQGVIHRDVKPHNLILGPNDRLHLTDFGLARLMDEDHLTMSGEVMGTPAYLSPEQVSGHVGRIDHRTDIYSLGVTLYEMLTRHKPFDGETREQIINGICTVEPPAPRRLEPRIPVDLETICLRAIAKTPAQRHATAAELAEDLRRFAAGRPILSRRVTHVEKTIKWVRRHKALATAGVAVVAAVVLGGGLILTTRAARQREAGELLRGAYEQLAYSDYRTPPLVRDTLERAADLGADPHEVRVVRGLAAAGAMQFPEAATLLRAAVDADPNDLRAGYLLAWVQWESNEHAASQATFAATEQRGPPQTADVWFFRGLASQFAAPDRAIESYEQANALRAQAHAFYPQALLHLARARNQQLYATRSLDGFDEACGSLRQLAEHGYYGAFPHYLLSIAHRLAAEVYQGSQGTRGDQLVAQHYDEALRWARAGEALDPKDTRPISAEAECLESLGRYAEAIDARTRVIELARADFYRWEAYHYRWRLHYWLGQHDAALADLAACAGFDPESPLYAHVYPALVHADMGDMEVALAQARAVATEHPGRALDVLWSATCLQLLGEPEEARALLDDRVESVDFAVGLVAPETPEWLRALYDCCRGVRSFDSLDELTQGVESPWKLSGQADFHRAAVALAAGQREAALEALERAYRSFDGEQRYTYHARLLLVKMQEDASWTPRRAVSWGRVPGNSSGQEE